MKREIEMKELSNKTLSFHRIIPELAFPEAGFILNITLGALRQRSGALPEVQLWRSTGGNDWVKVQSISESAAVTYNIALNVHRYVVLPREESVPTIVVLTSCLYN